MELWGLQVPDWKEQDRRFTVSNNEGSGSLVYKSVDFWLVSAELAYDSVMMIGLDFPNGKHTRPGVTVCDSIRLTEKPMTEMNRH